MRNWWVRILRYAQPQSRGVFVLLMLTISLVGLDTLKPWPMKLVVDNVLSAKPLPQAAVWISLLPGATTRTGLLAWLTLGTIFLFLAGWLSRAVRAYVQVNVGAGMVFALAGGLFDHLQRMSLRFHGRQPTGDLVQRVMTDSNCVRDLATGVLLPLLTSLFSLVAMFAVMWRFDWQISLVALLAAPLLVALMRIFAKPMTDRRYEVSQMQGKFASMVEQNLTALPIVQAFGREPFEDRRFRILAEQTKRASIRTTISELQFGFSTSSITAAGTAAIMVLGGFHVLQGKLTIGGLIVLLSYLSSLYAPMETIAWLSSSYASAAAGARRVLEVLDKDHEVRDLPGARPLPTGRTGIAGQLRLEDVAFSYDGARPAIQGVSLEVKPGEVIAFVGPTGAGKSTLASLILRFFDPDEGRITLDGHDIRTIQLASYRSHVAIVLQDAFLLPMSIADNIAYGRPGASREETEKAAVMAQADKFIRKLPQGYDTVVGERGATLSGGERQRIAIARALLKDAPILILDEPTAALDTQTEDSILQALENLIEGRTTIIIAHRLSTIRRADRIVVLDRGEVVEVGRHSELLTQDGLYRRFCELQFGPSVEHAANKA